MTATRSATCSTTLQVVGDEEIGQVEFFLEAQEQIQNLCLHRNVECGDRLVGDEEFGLEGESTGDTDALAFAATELVRIPARELSS